MEILFRGLVFCLTFHLICDIDIYSFPVKETAAFFWAANTGLAAVPKNRRLKI
jgi:hypothetical protein